ncbi:putative leucine-rich repeat domain, L domain-containing protein [Rosa chinensis]|uniref:Putative leucine-rich repeat domain, L domain-containing protein n=2 Tax=Rosa chinensis TaxID=74649 RepID=A0A2P6QPE7_ROSCH|nr:putative leucine-rich repeat domain, L domain-containing protein [Rosa chinensis]
MNLSGCTSLKELPDFSGFPNLKRLDLSGCTSLVEVPDSIRFLYNLESLEANSCPKLATFPKIPVKMDSLRLLSLKGSDIRELDESIENLIGLEYLDLTDCKNMTTLPCSIYGLQNLWFLDLGECSKLVRFPTNTRILNVVGCSLSLPKLGVFSIAGCSLLSDCDFLTTLDCWETLQWLNLSRNNFVSLPACLTKFVKLRMLDFEGCKRLRGIPELPPSIVDLNILPEIPVKMDSLRGLSLSGSDIRELDESIENLIGLEKLDLWHCENLTTLPYNIYELHNLKTLHASGCSKLATFPKIPVKMDSLRELSLSGSDIRELDESIENLSGLEYLDLTHCKNLTTLPCSIYGLHNLKTLHARGCSKLATFPKIPVKMDSLRELYLSGSDIKELDESIENLIRLEYLDLTDCKNLTTLPCSIYGLHNLKTLHARGCSKLATFPKIPVKMDSLRELYLSGSDIRELDESIKNVIGLEYLDLTDCKNLTTLPCSIYGLHNLKTLHTRGCSKLTTFLNIPVKMDSLRELSLSGSDIKELDESVENLIGLEELDLWNCENLTTLPYNIYELHNLETLHARGCSKLATFPKISVKMDSLRRLSLKGSDIRELDESIENLIGLEYLDLTDCKNLITLPCSIYGLQNLGFLDLGECTKLVRFPTNTRILNVDDCSLSLPKLGVFSIAGCSSLSDCDFLMTLDCWETLQWLNLSRNNFISLPACLTKFVKLRIFDLEDCKRLREIPELPPNVKPKIRGCELLEERFSTLTNRGAVIEMASSSIEEPNPTSWLSLSSETPKLHRSTEEPTPTPVNPPISISQIPMIPDLQTHHRGWRWWRWWLSSANDDYHHPQEQQEHPISPQLPSLN